MEFINFQFNGWLMKALQDVILDKKMQFEIAAYIRLLINTVKMTWWN